MRDTIEQVERDLDAWRTKASAHLDRPGNHDTVANVGRCAGCAMLNDARDRLRDRKAALLAQTTEVRT